MSTILLLAGLSAAVSSLLALVRVRHPALLSFPVMLLGWLAGELAIFHLIAQVVATAILATLGGLDTAAGVVGLIAMAISWVALVQVQRIAGTARESLAETLSGSHPGAADQLRGGEAGGWSRRPFHHDVAGLEHHFDLAYGELTDQCVDVFSARGLTGGSDGTATRPLRPVLVYIHGGAWISGNKERHGLPLVHAAARAGWVVATINYRLGPKNRFDAQRADVDTAIQWVRDHIGEYGGDPSFIALSGASAGGHLASLAALTPAGEPVQACVPVYGAYDFTDHHGLRGYARMEKFLEKMVMATKLRDDTDGWQAASPLHVTHGEAPPFMVVQGRNDVLAWREEAEVFVAALRDAGSPVIYAEVPGAQHSFDLFHSVRSQAAVDAIVAFLDAVHAEASATQGTAAD